MTISNFPSLVSQNNSRTLERHVDVDHFQASWTIWHTGAIFGLAGGFIAGLTGLILCAATYFAATSISEVNILTDASLTGTVLTLSTIPLLMLGASCLDKIDDSVRKREKAFKEKKRARFADAELYQKQ